MTPVRLVELVTRATGRTPTPLDLDVWGEALACRRTTCPVADCPHDDEADAALRQHLANSTYPPTPADVRRLAVTLANVRVERELQAIRDAEARQAVPPTPEYLAAAEDFRVKQAEKAKALEVDADSVRLTDAQRDAARRAMDEQLAGESAGSPS